MYQYNRGIVLLVTLVIVVVLCYINVSLPQFKQYSLKNDSSSTVLNYKSLINSFTTTCTTPVRETKPQTLYYKLSPNRSYHYEFVYELQQHVLPIKESRLFVILAARDRSCIHGWKVSVTKRIMSQMRSSGYSILCICSVRRRYDVNTPVLENLDVKWIYLSLQIWMNEVYYKQFQHYPRLYLHGVSQGSYFGSLLCRVLPVQAQILTIFTGARESLLVRSDHDMDMQTRLTLDPVFANWYCFDVCYNTRGMLNIGKQCPFRNVLSRNYFYPVPPTQFVLLSKDPFLRRFNITGLVSDIRKDAFHLGGTLLTLTDALDIHMAHPLTITASYMKEKFPPWACKSFSSKLFYELFTGIIEQNKTTSKERTCRCAPTDFFYFERYPNETHFRFQKNQEEYNDYVKDFTRYKDQLCEELCGDLTAQHALTSRNIENSLSWVEKIDRARFSLQIKDYLSRPLRVWMYDGYSLTTKRKHLTVHTANRTSCGRDYMAQQMYSIEYFLHDYFRRLNVSAPLSLHNLVWAVNPLHADYFIISHDIGCYTYEVYKKFLTNRMTLVELLPLYENRANDYIWPLLMNVRNVFPFWNMTSGSNHIIVSATGMNMGAIKVAGIINLLKNVIQLGLTGFRQDLLPSNSSPLYSMPIFNITAIYRHNYDVIVPPFNKLQLTAQKLDGSNTKTWYEEKTALFFLAGTLNSSRYLRTVRMQLALLANDISDGKRYNSSTLIEGKQFKTMIVNHGYMAPATYVESIRSTVFSLSPEGVSPWTPRIYEAISLGAIPLLLVDSVVLPFERFINWRSFSAKINVSQVRNMPDLVTRTSSFEQYVKKKLEHVILHSKTFLWPYSPVDDEHSEHLFLPDEDLHGTAKNVFHYISLELRCRRLEQLYGLTSDSFSPESITAQRQACKNHPTICPCHNERNRLAFNQYL